MSEIKKLRRKALFVVLLSTFFSGTFLLSTGLLLLGKKNFPDVSMLSYDVPSDKASSDEIPAFLGPWAAFFIWVGFLLCEVSENIAVLKLHFEKNQTRQESKVKNEKIYRRTGTWLVITFCTTVAMSVIAKAKILFVFPTDPILNAIVFNYCVLKLCGFMEVAVYRMELKTKMFFESIAFVIQNRLIWINNEGPAVV